MTLRVIHATESLASGVMDLLSTITRRQLDEGATVSLVYASRPDTPTDAEIRHIFDPRLRLVKAAGRDDAGWRAAIALRKSLLRELEHTEYDALHLHSTVAGFLGRFGPGMRKHRARTFYSPHGFGFLRQDLRPVIRAAVRLAEHVASQRSFLITSTQSEADVALAMLGSPRNSIVVNGIDTEGLPRVREHAPGRLHVAMVGRVVYQKAPWVFARVAAELAELADFTWFGDGDPEDVKRWLGGSPVENVSRMSLEKLRARLSEVDVFLFPTLWEGMPLSLIEAQCIGVPAVATRIVGNKDIVVDGVTGFLCDSEEELLARTRQLLGDPGLRASMSERALSSVRERFDNRTMGFELLEIYREVVPTKLTSP